ncbi:MAG: hypothetical protein ACP5UZ_08200, partial [Thermoplasmata archaeon]
SMKSSSSAQGSGVMGRDQESISGPLTTGSLTVTISPASSTLDVGQYVVISVVNPYFAFTYVWYVGGIAVTGANQASYKFIPQAPGTYQIYVNVTNGTQQANSNIATVTVNSALAVTISPMSEKVYVGQTVTFQSTVTGGTGDFHYLWYLNGSETSTTTSSYTLTPAGNATYYVYVVVSDIGTTKGVPSTPTVQSSTAQIIAAIKTYQVSFEETGLPTGTRWYVNLTNLQSHSTILSVDQFNETNGTYYFYVASGNKIYTPSPSSGTFIIDGSPVTLLITFTPVLYQVTFNETGLPLGTLWYANITGHASLSSNSSTIKSSISNGSYNFSISTVNKEYFPTPFSGSFKINGRSESISVQFSLYTYTVEFTESGLPLNTEWFISVVGISPNPITNESSSSFSQVISLSLPNGTYTYKLASGIQTYGPYPASGNLTVSGSPVSIAVAFLRLYQVTFVETGLPIPYPNVKWFLNISDPQSYNSTTDTISFWEPNQTYSYSVSTNDKWYVPAQSIRSGSITVSGSSVKGPQIIFNELLNVSFQQQKLPSGNTWYVNITGGGTFYSSNGTIFFMEINGTYSYNISSGNKLYRPIPYRGSFIPNTTNFPIRITFSLVTYPVTFSETGLTNGTIWSVTINNDTRISTNGTIVYKLNNGSFDYSIQPIPGFSADTYAGNLTVNGSFLVQSVSWTLVTYYINITQSGLTAGKRWSVTLQGKTFNGVPVSVTLNTTRTSVVFQEPNGTYNYTINAPFGYTGTHMTGKVIINGNSAAAVATLVPPNFTLIGIVGAVGVALLAIALMFMIRRENRSFFVREGKYVKKGKYLKYKK